MTLDMPTISVVAISVSAILGLVLLFAWWRERTSALTGWWGLAQLVLCAGIVIALTASIANDPNLLAFGQATMLFSAAIMWLAVRQFDGRRMHPVWMAAAPAALLAGRYWGAFDTFDDRLIVVCSMLAILSFAAAFELSRDGAEGLMSRWPAVVLLAASGAGYLTWLPFTMHMPIREVSFVFASKWFPAVILAATLCRIALAFVVLAMVKERQELQQRLDALTDPLTGLPNRRALFEAAEKLAEHSKYLKGDPISVLVFDLDHFKKINDTFGHRLGDRVLQLFARTMSERLETGSIVGRPGGEEFAAILPGADLVKAGAAAEQIRAAFAANAIVIDGATVAGTVSVGAACSDDIDCDLGSLFHRADGALYAAKTAGRNRVEVIAAQTVVTTGPIARSTPAAYDGYDRQVAPRIEKWANTRRYRRSRPAESAPSRQRRDPALS